ncbi:uncharacterized protein LOC130974880 [Arachis stenosperma]|uniref:uncharacterized protein LOC130974880 n=1 Tax=Arachis stenosperma TaxID=217475 RepID=UPI0025AC9739|nr:uncharacterized protein LOC130974880 [Arachis stenosperma]
MGKCQAMHKYVGVFLALLVAFNHTHLTQGRKIIKPLNTNNITLDHDSSSVGDSGKKSMVVLLESLEAKKVSVNGVGPGPSPGAGHRKTDGKDNVMKSMGAVVVVVKNNQDVKDSINGVGPGHSPGVGHKN